ncbi:DUF883 domain-containing protein [Paracoccus bogoriensis]|uniref:DUF883 family protein n=1 Tax=Paracoccus bogoriensis TaxID=242065 RepID=UPI001CA52143|nr:DUF883 domain-containing protein [Paracoccus bogoriensis]MBW7056481.1 DUF883 domain-containing protein [Paracoccus bogoriensis]
MAQNISAEEAKRDAKDAVREARDDLERGARKVGEQVRETARDLADNSGAERLMERGSELAEEVVQVGREYADKARHEAERLYEAGQRHAHDAAAYAEERYDEVAEMVRRNPAQALGIAAGIGFLVGLLISRR